MAITWDNDKRAWIFDDVTEVDQFHFNNLLKWGQPYNPYEPGFRHDLYDGEHMIISPTVIFNNQDVLTHGYGQNIQLTDFDVVKNLQEDGANIPNGTYTLIQLQNLGLSSPGQFGDHAMGTNLYLNQSGVGVSPNLGAGTAAYVFGSIRLQMSNDSTFIIENGQLVSVNGRIELQPDNFNHESTTLPEWVSAIVAIVAGDTVNFDEVIMLYEGQGAERTVDRIIPQEEYCFLAGTMIDMADGSQKPIEDIRPEDQVMAFDKDGNKVAGRVTRTMTNESKIILDFHGTFVTPGHVYYCAGGKFEGGFAPIIDILRDDGVVQHEDNTLIRAATGCVVGSELDAELWVLGIEADANGVYHEKIRKKLRLGTRFIVQGGKSVSIAEDLQKIGMRARADGFVEHIITGKRALYQWPVAGQMPPNPEDYVLQRSGTTLEDIYRAGEWEGQRPQMPPPMIRDGGEVTPVSERTLMAMPRNVPMAMREGTPADSAPKLNRKARKAMEAKRRKAAKHTRGNATLH